MAPRGYRDIHIWCFHLILTVSAFRSFMPCWRCCSAEERRRDFEFRSMWLLVEINSQMEMSSYITLTGQTCIYIIECLPYDLNWGGIHDTAIFHETNVSLEPQ